MTEAVKQVIYCCNAQIQPLGQDQVQYVSFFMSGDSDPLCQVKNVINIQKVLDQGFSITADMNIKITTITKSPKSETSNASGQQGANKHQLKKLTLKYSFKHDLPFLRCCEMLTKLQKSKRHQRQDECYTLPSRNPPWLTGS